MSALGTTFNYPKYKNPKDEKYERKYLIFVPVNESFSPTQNADNLAVVENQKSEWKDHRQKDIGHVFVVEDVRS